ncbi:MFS transporter [Paenibacillus gansuensis]|uniref:MFS transporter n=1 Tax=Paenibacillus gansuensis TaxID=306542 RepID=A0ABW5PDU1_9BACL
MSMSFVSKYPKEAWPFMAASLINSLGSAFMWPVITIYVHEVLNRSYGDAGFALLCFSSAMMIGQFAVSALYQRLGIKILLIGGLLLQGLAQIALVADTGWALFLVLMTMNGFFSGLSMPAIQAFVGLRWKKTSGGIFNFIYVGNNIGIAVGTALAGVTATFFSFGANFAMSGLTTLLFAFYMWLTIGKMKVAEQKEMTLGGKKNAGTVNSRKLLLNYRLYLFMSVGSLLIWFSNSVWNTGIAPYLNEQGDNGLTSYGLLWTINGIIIFAGQPILSFFKSRVLQTLTSQMTVSAFCYGAGYTVMLIAPSYHAFIIGMIIATFGEMLIAPTMPAFITEHAGGYAPFYLGIAGAISAAGRIVGPYVLGNVYDWGGLHQVLLISIAGTAAAAISFMAHSSLHQGWRERNWKAAP